MKYDQRVNMSSMLKELEDIGLSEKEARVYAAALELGRATAEKLSTHAKVNRSTTYVQLESLMKKGLISTNEEGKKTYFAAESPELLKRLLLRQREDISLREKELASLLPILLRQFEGAGERPLVRFFPGEEGVTTAREEFLTTKEKKTCTIFSYEHLRKLYSEKELDDFTNRRKALGIHSKGIQVHKEFFHKADLDKLTERRFLPPSVLPLSIDLYLFDDRLAITSLEGNLFGMVVESKQIVSSMKSIFNFLWERAEVPQSKK
jgi:HTH-type transcriptional regulator, sugar sensing transcriptional regulator